MIILSKIHCNVKLIAAFFCEKFQPVLRKQLGKNLFTMKNIRKKLSAHMNKQLFRIFLYK